MWRCEYGKEPFDMRLFVLLCRRRLWMVLAGILAGAALAGGVYYMKNVTFGGVIPYTMDSNIIWSMPLIPVISSLTPILHLIPGTIC